MKNNEIAATISEIPAGTHIAFLAADGLVYEGDFYGLSDEGFEIELFVETDSDPELEIRYLPFSEIVRLDSVG